jgi:GT2 family glycosyltransferase
VTKIDEQSPRVGVILVNYAVDPAVLRATVAALLASTGDVVLEIVLVDNASPTNRSEARRATENLARTLTRIPPVRWVDNPTNRGFAGGVNAGLDILNPQCTYVFLCNPDAVVEPDAIARCVAALEAAPDDCMSVAPKMLLSQHGLTERVLDSVGNAVNEKGEAFNIGLGQPDLGQYDRPTFVFGPCFGAALFRLEAFGESHVGRLDEDLFLYYEDVDWNWRSQLLGYSSITEPRAIVHHSMSITMRDNGYDAKFHLTERNLMICALKNFELATGMRVCARRALGLLKGSLTGRHYPIPGLKAIGGFVGQLPRTLAKRRRLQRRRTRGDAAITAFGVGEKTFFDAVRYVPMERAQAHAFAIIRTPPTEATPPAQPG